MATLSKTIKLPALQKTLAEFMKESEAMDMKQEVRSQRPPRGSSPVSPLAARR